MSTNPFSDQEQIKICDIASKYALRCSSTVMPSSARSHNKSPHIAEMIYLGSVENDLGVTRIVCSHIVLVWYLQVVGGYTNKVYGVIHINLEVRYLDSGARVLRFDSAHTPVWVDTFATQCRLCPSKFRYEDRVVVKQDNTLQEF